MAGEEGQSRWVFTQNELSNTPSRKSGVDADKELSYRQQAANFIQDMGQRLQVTQLCINTAIVYMHRFYMFHSFTKFHRNNIAAACLFLAAKVEEQPRKLEHVIKVAHMCTARDATPLDVKSETYLEQAQELVVNENILLQTLGFEITVDHPHTQVVKTCQLVHASKDLAQTSYFLATNSLHLTSMCLQYKPVVVACVCIHLAIKWANLEIPCSSEGKEWWWYADKSLTLQTLEGLAQDFLNTLDKCPSKLKKKILTWKAGGASGELEPTPTGPPPKKVRLDAPSTSAAPPASPPGSSAGHNLHKCASAPVIHDATKPAPSTQREPILSQIKQEKDAASLAAKPVTPDVSSRKPRPEVTITPKEYLERKERERLAQAAITPQSAKHTSIKTEQHRTEPYHDFSPKKSNSPHMPPGSKHRPQSEQNKHKHESKMDVKSEHRERHPPSQSHHRSEDKKTRHHLHSLRHSDQQPKPSQSEAKRPPVTEAEKRVAPMKIEVKQEPDVKVSRRESHRSKEHRSRHSSSGSSHHKHDKEHHHRKRQHKSPGSSQAGTESIPPLKIHKGELAQHVTSPAKVPSLKIKLPPKPPHEGELPNSHNGNGTSNLNHTLSSPNSAPVTKTAITDAAKQIHNLVNALQKKKDKTPQPPPPSSDSKPPLPPMPPPP